MSTGPDIFLSFTRKDQATAQRFAQALEAGGSSVWWNQALNAGETFDQVTKKALHDARAVVVLWSKHSVDSRRVRAEATKADERRKLVPVLIGPCSVPIKFQLRQMADLSAWKGSAQDSVWRQFVAGLEQYVGKQGGSAPSSASAPAAKPAAARRLAPMVAIAAAVLVAVAAGAWLMGRGSQQGDETQQASVAAQSELAADVAQAPSVKLDAADFGRTKGGTTNVEAYDRWLQARALFGQASQQAVRQALELAREAVRLDPQFSLGWNQLWMLLGNVNASSEAERAAFGKEAEAAAARAVELGPDSWWGKSIQAVQLEERHEWSGAVAAGEAAVEGPTNAFNYNRELPYATLMIRVGRAQDAVRHLRKAIEVEPKSLSLSVALQKGLYALGDTQGGEAEYQRSLGLSRNNADLHFLQLLRLLAGGDATQPALQAQLELFASSANMADIERILLRGWIANSAGALATMRSRIDSPDNQKRDVLVNFAFLADALGDRELVARALVKPQFPRDQTIWMLPYSGVRSDPAFKQTLRDLKLVDYWRESGNWGDFCKPVGADDFECH